MCVCHGVCRLGASILIYISGSPVLPINTPKMWHAQGFTASEQDESLYPLLDPSLSEHPRVGGYQGGMLLLLTPKNVYVGSRVNWRSLCLLMVPCFVCLFLFCSVLTTGTDCGVCFPLPTPAKSTDPVLYIQGPVPTAHPAPSPPWPSTVFCCSCLFPLFLPLGEHWESQRKSQHSWKKKKKIKDR